MEISQKEVGREMISLLFLIKQIQITNQLEMLRHLTSKTSAIMALLFLHCCLVYSQVPTIESTNNENTRTFKLIIQNPLTKPIVITKVGAKISNLTASRATCCGGSTLETQDSRPLQIDANYSVSIPVLGKKESEVLQDAEPPVLIGSGSLTRISISVLPSIEYFDTCYRHWQFDISVFVIYKNTANGEVGRIVAPHPIVYTKKEYLSYDAKSMPLLPQELKTALTHISPTIRSYALRQLIDSKINKNIVEGILRAKLENDPNEEVKIAAAYVAARLCIRDLGRNILDQLKTTRDANAIEIYCWALAELQCADAIDWFFNALFNLNLSSSFDSYGREYHYTPEEALVEIALSNVPMKGREAFFKYRSWAGAGATEEQCRRFSKLSWILLKYRDINSIHLLLEIVREPRFFHLDNPLYRVLSDFIIDESNTNPESLINDEFTLGLRPAFERVFDFQDPRPIGKDSSSYGYFLSPRSFAFSLLCRMPLEKQNLKYLLLRGFQDKDMQVRVEASNIAGILKLKEFVPRIISLLEGLDKGDWPTSWLCKSLEKLGTSHKDCSKYKD
jgi:hypothetical protein